MDYEKEYKEAFRKIAEWYNLPDVTKTEKERFCQIFPQLKESEDERIRKELVVYLKTRKGYTEAIKDCWIAYLEKKKEQKPVRCVKTFMTLDEAIAHCEEKSDDTPCGKEHKQLAKWLKELRELRKQKPIEWSEEDERNLNTIVNVIYGGTHLAYEEEIDWLKSLKERILNKTNE